MTDTKITPIAALEAAVRDRRNEIKCRKSEFIDTKYEKIWIKLSEKIEGEYDFILAKIAELKGGLKNTVKIINECFEKETHLDEELCQRCPLFRKDEAGIFCSYFVLLRLLELDRESEAEFDAKARGERKEIEGGTTAGAVRGDE